MSVYPLFFNLTNVVEGKDFSAVVLARGRCLLSLDDGEWVMSGVNPGGMAEAGSSPIEAFDRFRTAFRDILETAAADHATYEAFETDVRGFFNQANESAEVRWGKAVEATRAGNAQSDPFVQNLPKLAAEGGYFILIDHVARFQTSDWVPELAKAA